MDVDAKRRLNNKPTKSCQYGSNCYRKNPQHFAEYNHKHLTEIYDQGKDVTSKEYTIPDELFLSKDTILEQLEILEKLFPKPATTPAKRKKLEEQRGDQTPSNSSTKEMPEEQKKPLKAETNKDDRKTPIDSSSCPSGSQQKNKDIKTYADHEIKSMADQLKERLERLKKTDLSNSTTTTMSSSSSTSSSATSIAKPSTSSTSNASSGSNGPNITKNIHDYISVVIPKGKMAEKLEKAAPYNFFLTTITESKQTHNEPLSITLQEILDSSLGEIEQTAQFNFMIDIGWLLGHYYFAGILDKPLLVLYGDETPDLKMVTAKKPQVTTVKVQMSSPFGTHHTKMMLLGYKDGSMRVVVSTANLVEDDWHNRTQGLWISPKCPAIPVDGDTEFGNGPTNFREDLVRYLVSYNIPKLQPWIVRIRKTNFNDVNVFLVASVPGGHRDTPKGHHWGHAKVGHLLSKHSAPIPDTCPIVAQSSSIGSLGPSLQTWIQPDIIGSFRKDTAPVGLRKIPTFKMIFPSFSNVKNSHDDLLGGGGLPYRRAINEKQPWLKGHLHQWKSRTRHRSQAMPHIKTYCRWSERGLYWFLLTSANLSKAAMGAFNKGSKLDVPLRIMSYECGVLFLPKYVMPGENVFPMNVPKNSRPPFPMPYDVPLTPYATDDTPFFMDYLLEG